LFIGLVTVALGLLGLAAPQAFLNAASFFLHPPMLYVAAVIRGAIAVVIYLAAPGSRTPKILRGLAVFIGIFALATPFVGLFGPLGALAEMAASGSGELRIWAATVLALGLFVVVSTIPRRET
jgi:hypothetical protein